MVRAVVGNLGETVSKVSDSFTDLPKINAPFTTVVNRAQVTDFAADGLPKWGLDRFTTQQVNEVQNEQGPNGERVFKALNDIHDQVRFVGVWANAYGLYGQYVVPDNTSTNYFEITFYGTGLNLLVVTGFSYDFRASVDGGAESGNLYTTSAAIINGRGNNSNTVFSVASTSLGMHTVKIKVNSSAGIALAGYEVVNASASIFVPSATTYSSGKRLSASSGTTTYNSGFESGTLGAFGGHVLVYQKSDGTIAKSVTPTNSSPAYLTSASHTNEEMIRRYHWREFGAGRADDFSVLSTTISDRAFTLDDGTTNLVGYQVANTTGSEFLLVGSVGSFITLTFVGTGLDVVRQDDTTVVDPYSVTVDGTNQGNLSAIGTGSIPRVTKIASGLPYGTHTVKITRTAAVVGAIRFRDFIVYVPRKPTLPSGAVELSNYFIMANYVPNATASSVHIGKGVLRKTNARENIYVDGTGGTTNWIFSGVSVDATAGFQLFTDRQNAYVEYIFFGTGFEQRFQIASNRSSSIQVSLQNISAGGVLQNLTLANFASIATSTYGTGAAFNTSTGILDQQDASTSAGGGLVVSNLPLSLYKVRLLNNTASSYILHESFDVVTPIHTHKEMGASRLQNVNLIGSSGIGDLRVFSPKQVPTQKAWSQANSYQNMSTTVTSFVPTGLLSLVINLKKEKTVDISFSGMAFADAASTVCEAQIYLNGNAISQTRNPAISTAGYQTPLSDRVFVRLPAGTHKVDVYIKRVSGTIATIYLASLLAIEVD